MSTKFGFKIIKKDKKTRARTAILKTPHGEIHTPYFVPVATHAAVKTLSPDDLKLLGAEILLSNTYHLFLRPGSDIIKKFGGLHKFMNWQKPIMTDSGGFQIFSLGAGLEQGVGKIINFFPGKADCQKSAKSGFVKITDDGVYFKSHLDGKSHFLTPEKSIKIQEELGPDIILAFDECTSPLSSYEYIKKSMERTHRWAIKCLKAKKRNDQALFGIIQGGAYKDLRKESAKFISSLPFFGLAIGGTLGKTKQEMKKVLNWCADKLPENKPRHLLGIGEPKDILLGIEAGMDTFDCVMPTRLARHGIALTKKGRINIAKAVWKNKKIELESECYCYACSNFSIGYIHHIFRCGEILAHRLLTCHNLYFMLNFMKEVRNSINNGKFSEYKKKFEKKYKA